MAVSVGAAIDAGEGDLPSQDFFHQEFVIWIPYVIKWFSTIWIVPTTVFFVKLDTNDF